MKKKVVSVLLVGAMAGTMLAGCGGDNKAADAGDNTKKEDTADKSDSSDSGDDSSAEGKVTLNVTTTFAGTESNVDKYQETIENWQKETGNKVNDSSASADEAMKARVITDFETGAEPDVMFYFNGNDSNPFVEADKVVPIDEIREKYPDYAANMNDDLIPGSPVDGVKYAVPFYGYWEGMYVNKKVCEDAGVEIPGPDTTWEQFMETCQKIKDAGYTPITCDDAYILCLFGYHMSRLNGYDKTSDIVKNNKWDDPSVMETAKAYADFAQKGYFSENIASNVFPAGQNQELALGTAAMYLNGSWLPNEVKNMAGDDFQWGCFSYPAVEGGTDGPEAANYGGQVLAINKNSQNAEDAFKLITYITKGEFDKKLSEESLGIPSDTTNSEWPVQLTDVKPVMESLKTRYPWAAGAEDNVDMTPIIKENMTKLCSGAITADEFVSSLQAAGK